VRWRHAKRLRVSPADQQTESLILLRRNCRVFQRDLS
jgi:hypothetical protein